MTAPMPWEQQTGLDPMSLADSENAMRWVLRAMHDAAKELKRLRNAEVEAKHEFEAAKRQAFFSAECPKPERGGYTVADREAFLDRETVAEKRALDLASVAREAAQDHVKTLSSQSVVMSSLAKNVQQTYGVVGTR